MSAAPFLALPALLALTGAVQEGRNAAPRRGIDGIGGFEVESRVVFAAAPDEPHRLTVVQVFPDRARWWIGAVDGGELERSLYHRFGREAWGTGAGETESKAFETDLLDRTLLQMELRRAAFLYPLGLSWREEDGVRSAPVRRDAVSPEEAPIGRIVVQEREGRLHLSALDSDGEELESIEVLERRAFGTRTWPSRLVLRQSGETVWTETVRAVSTDLHYADRFFVPADRRPDRAVFVGDHLVRAVDLGAITFRAHELPDGSSWSDALARAAVWIEAARAEAPAGRGVDPVPCFELDERARPRRCLVRLEGALAEPPAGWSTRRDRPGLAILLDGVANLDGGALELLRRAVPPGERGEGPYCRVTDARGPFGVQLYLPLLAEPREDG